MIFPLPIEPPLEDLVSRINSTGATFPFCNCLNPFSLKAMPFFESQRFFSLYNSDDGAAPINFLKRKNIVRYKKKPIHNLVE